MGKELLLEIGTEEIPATFLPKALVDMEEIIRDEFSNNRIRHGQVRTMATPRRLLLYVADLSEEQEDEITEKLGPAKRVAFDENGNPTRAALGFARGQKIDISEIETVTTEKGEYICARKETKGEKTKTILPDLLIKFITSIPFQKSMRWSNLDLRFARPIHWILALYGGDLISFKIENLESGSKSCGHRFMSPEFFEVGDFEDYMKKTRERFVIVDPAERRKIILEESKKAAEGVSGKVLVDHELLETVTFLVEYPTVVCGSFDREYLKLPRDVLVTSMMKHQKYFPVIDENGSLIPWFITINNTLARDPSMVARGNERVLRARLADAVFFFDEDKKIPLGDRVDDLKNVVFHSLLGTSYEKVTRFRQLSVYIAEKINPDIKGAVKRTAYLSKADLDTRMVGEFPNLQGIMGREYALIAGESPIVAKAIYEHYLPTSAGGKLPETDEGAIVSIADKMDTIVGCFGVNLIPTGDADPYALRRQALGIINIILDKNYHLQLEDLTDKSISILDNKLMRTPEDTREDVLGFFKGRLRNQLVSRGRSYDVVDSVLATGASDLAKSLKKIAAMEKFKKHPDFEPLTVAFKRVGNILKGFKNGAVDASLFESDEERKLHNAYLEIKGRVSAYSDRNDYNKVLLELASLREPVDDFFENILVMAKDEKIRFNRLSLLEEVSRLFYEIADFSKIVTERINSDRTKTP